MLRILLLRQEHLILQHFSTLCFILIYFFFIYFIEFPIAAKILELTFYTFDYQPYFQDLRLSQSSYQLYTRRRSQFLFYLNHF